MRAVLLRQTRWSRWAHPVTSSACRWCPYPASRRVCSLRGCMRARTRRLFSSHPTRSNEGGRSNEEPAPMTPASDIGRRPHDERGSATVVMLGVIASVLMLTISGLLLASAVLASHRARAAADLAALAAAGVLMRGGPTLSACESAAHVAALNHGRVQQCVVSGPEVRLRVAVVAGVKGVGVASARSRAGPGPSGGQGRAP